jgi:predicted kinase
MLLDLPPGAPVDLDALAAWLDPIAPIARLADTPIDEHARVDTWTHTCALVQALVAGDRYVALPVAARRIVATAGALHGIGTLRATRYEAASEAMARAALWRAGVPFASREHICSLIRHHTLPLWGVQAPDADQIARRVSLSTRHDWLVAIAGASGMGDVAPWLERCRELGIAAGPQRFASDHTRVVYFESETRRPEDLAYDDTTCEVIVMCGLPASGKSTWLAEHHAGLERVSLDDLRTELDVDPADGQGAVVDAARERARVLLRAATPFAWNATNLTRKHRRALVQLIRMYRGRAHLVYCEASAADLTARNRGRAATVPARAMARMIDRWTVPDPSEAHRVSYVVPDDGDETWPPC